MKGKMIDKLNDRSRAVLDALREGRHAPVLRTPAPSPAPETRPLRDLRVHTDGRARQALSASSHLLNRLLHRASGPSESRHRTRGSAPTSRTSQRDRRRRQGNRGRGWPH